MIVIMVDSLKRFLRIAKMWFLGVSDDFPHTIFSPLTKAMGLAFARRRPSLRGWRQDPFDSPDYLHEDWKIALLGESDLVSNQTNLHETLSQVVVSPHHSAKTVNYCTWKNFHWQCAMLLRLLSTWVSPRCWLHCIQSNGKAVAINGSFEHD